MAAAVYAKNEVFFFSFFSFLGQIYGYRVGFLNPNGFGPIFFKRKNQPKRARGTHGLWPTGKPNPDPWAEQPRFEKEKEKKGSVDG
jgi:hypothetical protein